MAKEETETQTLAEEETRTPQITASKQLWAAFDKWCALMGSQRLPEGIRAAMQQVTGFTPQSQGDFSK